MNEIFTDDFLSFGKNRIQNDLAENGYFSYKKAFNQDFIESIKKDISSHRLSLNKNRIGGVQLKSQYFNTFLLAISKSFYEYCTNNLIFKISENYLNSKNFRLKSLRYYETYGNNVMKWHTDTKTSTSFKAIKGLIFICYLSDVNDGEFQYISGSHLISQKVEKNDFTNEEIEDLFGAENIKSFKGESGTIIIYDTAGIHRAKTASRKDHFRSSLFFQVDCEDNSEPIYINPKYLNNLNDQIQYYLGFGRNSDYVEYPQSSLEDLPLNFFLKIFISKLVINFLKTLKNKILNNSILKKIKNKNSSL